MDPVSLAVIAGIGSKVAGFIGGMQAAKGKAAALKQQARWEMMLAAYSYQDGAIREGMSRLEGSLQAGTARTQYAISGVDVMPDAIRSMEILNSYRSSALMVAASRAALGHRTQATVYYKQAANIESNMIWSMLGTGLGGAADIAGTQVSSYHPTGPDAGLGG